MSLILHQNSKGIQMVRDDFKVRSQVKVINTASGKNYCLRTYRFDLVHEPIEVPYCSWANLDCCGGWSFDEEYLDTAVQNGLKLFAGRDTWVRDLYRPYGPSRENLERKFRDLKADLPSGIFADIEGIPSREDCFSTYICRAGRITDYIDLDLVFGFYQKLGLVLSEYEKAQVKRLCNYEIRLYGTAQAPFVYSDAVTTAELITTGLLLGYPIESTASILQGY